MEKILFLLPAAIFAVSFTACDEDFNKDVAPPQQWEQEAAKSISFEISPVSTIDLSSITSDIVQVCSFTAPSVENGEVEGYELGFPGDIKLSMDEKGQVSKAELQQAVETIHGKRPEARTTAASVNAMIKVGEQIFRTENTVEIRVIPEAPFIDNAYYLIGNMNDWTADNVSALIKLNQSGDVYEHPVFSTVLEISADCYWKVIPHMRVEAFENGEAENVWGEGVLGCEIDGDESLSGTLFVDGNAMKITDAGWVKIELNMMEYSYTVTALGNVSPYMYVPGNHQGWDPASAPSLYSTDFMSYSGFVALDGDFKVTSQQNWDGPNYGAGDVDGTLSTDGGAGNLNTEAGFYLLKANTSDLTWSATEIETFGLIGSATQGGWDSSTSMTFDAENLEYTVTTTLVDGEMKFRANDKWDVNLGGDMSNLTFSGDNIPVTAGVYQITLSLSNPEKFTCKIEQQ